MRRAFAPLLCVLFVLPGCSLTGGSEGPTYRAMFVRAIQVFPAIKVRVLGVDVGVVTDVRTAANGVQVTFRMDDPTTKLPANVQAAVVPMSLLGERYIQLFPSYQSGPALQPGSTIPLTRTTVPAEPDELLRSLQDYLGALDPETVTRFVENAARAVDGAGEDLNRLIHSATAVLETLSAKGGDISKLIVELEKLTVALSTRQQAIGQLIRNYGAVAGTLNQNRAALEGTIDGLNDAAVQLAALLVAHRQPLHFDIQALTRSGQTLARNAEALAETGHWATLLFRAAERAVDYNHDWLRLGNQGEELGALILLRLEQRLMEICADLGIPACTTPAYWSTHVPSLFCFVDKCPRANGSAAAAASLASAFRSIPELRAAMSGRAREQGTNVRGLVDDLLGATIGDTNGVAP